MAVSEDGSSEDGTADLFQEPGDFYVPDKLPTFTEYSSQRSGTIKLRLVGHNPLWGHLLWNAGQVVAQYLEDNVALIRDKTVLELGAGAGLPSLICAINGAKQVVVTDYPDIELIENLRYNIEHCQALTSKDNISAEGYLWGNDVAPLTTHLPAGPDGFDVLILADILFNHSEHQKLISTIERALHRDHDARCCVFFTPYRPWLLEKDLNFFKLATEAGLQVEKLFEHTMDKAMFPEDPGDEKLRRTVFAYELKWKF